MASLSNINGLFDVHSTGAILFSTSHGTSGQILKSNGNAAPTWVAASTVIGGPYLPLTGGTLSGPLAGTSATFSGNATFAGNGVEITGTEVIITPNIATSAFVLNGQSRKYKMLNYSNQFYIQDFTVNAPASTTRLMINGDGDIGIGTTSPGSTLTLGNATGNVAELRVLRSNSLSTTYGFINTVGGTAQLGGSSDTRIIASTGRLLFNSNSTDQISLEANGEYRLKLGSTTTGYEASMDNSNTAYRIFGSRFGGTGKYVAIWSDGANENTRFYPTKTVFYKNVGIGTDSPVSTWLNSFDPTTGNGTFKLTSEG